MRENVSRRRVLTLSGAFLSGVSMTDAHQLFTQPSDSTIEGWITKGEKMAIAETRATIERFQYLGSSLCNDGDVFECRTCPGVEFYLLVPSDSPQPTVSETYRFSTTGEDNECGNFRVQLLEANSCENSTETTTTTSTETTTTRTTTTTTDTPTTTETPTDND